MNETTNQSRIPMTQTERLRQFVKENLVNMLKYDGLIREIAIDNLKTLYPAAVVTAAMKFAENTDNISFIFSACDRAYNSRNSYILNFLDENGNCTEEADEFTAWYLDNCARLAFEECKTLVKETASAYEERMRVNELFDNRDYLQREILKLNLGYEGPKMAVQEIAKLPEYNGREDYVLIVLNKIGDTTAYSKKITKRQKNKEVQSNAKV